MVQVPKKGLVLCNNYRWPRGKKKRGAVGKLTWRRRHRCRGHRRHIPLYSLFPDPNTSFWSPHTTVSLSSSHIVFSLVLFFSHSSHPTLVFHSGISLLWFSTIPSFSSYSYFLCLFLFSCLLGFGFRISVFHGGLIQ